MKGTVNFITGVAIGAVVGAVAGLLLAPESGKKTLKKLSKEADKFKDELLKASEDKFGKFTKELNEKVGEYAEIAKDKLLNKDKKSAELN